MSLCNVLEFHHMKGEMILIQPLCLEKFFRVLDHTFIKAHQYSAKVAFSFCHCWMWSIFWSLTLWKLGVTFWPAGWSEGLLTGKAPGENLPFGSTCSTVGLNLITAITVLFPLCYADEAFGLFLIWFWLFENPFLMFISTCDGKWYGWRPDLLFQGNSDSPFPTGKEKLSFPSKWNSRKADKWHTMFGLNFHLLKLC